MPRFEVILKPTSLPKNYAKERGAECRLVVDEADKQSAAINARNFASLSGYRGYAITSVKELPQ